MEKKIGLLIIVLLMVMACNEDGFTTDFVAGNVFTDSNIRVVQVDTITVETSTMKFDSIITSQATRILVGKYTDPVFGTVQSSSYAQLLPSSYTIDAEAEYDSIVFYLNYDEYFYNDTLQQNSIHIKKLIEQLKPEDDTNFYNTSTISYEDEDIGFISFAPRPLQVDSLEIKIEDDFGVAIFENLQDKTITDSDEFAEYFKGIVFKPGEADDGSVLGFSITSSLMRLYFSTSVEDERVQEYLDFTINTTTTPIPFFNQVITEDANEYIEQLEDQELDLNSTETDNQSYIQSGLGIATKVQFPHIKSIYDIPGEGTILDAVLKIKPVEGSYDDQLPLRESISVYIVDQNNDLTGQLYSADGEIVTAILNTDNQEFNDIYYEVYLGSYIDGLLNADRDTGEALILIPSDYNTTVDRYVLNGNNSSDYQTIMELTYVIYDDNE
ncbi:MAG: DUF4270 family protein [Flavobacteriaceae bacterium]